MIVSESCGISSSGKSFLWSFKSFFMVNGLMEPFKWAWSSAFGINLKNCSSFILSEIATGSRDGIHARIINTDPMFFLLVRFYLLQIYSFPSLTMGFPPLILPVLLAAIRPTLRPAEVPRLTVDALPICWWLPPPWVTKYKKKIISGWHWVSF